MWTVEAPAYFATLCSASRQQKSTAASTSWVYRAAPARARGRPALTRPHIGAAGRGLGGEVAAQPFPHWGERLGGRHGHRQRHEQLPLVAARDRAVGARSRGDAVPG